MSVSRVLGPLALLACAACEGEHPAPAASGAPSPRETAAPPTATSPVAPAPPASQAEAPKEIAAQHVLVAWGGAKGAPKTVKRSKDEARKRAEEVLAKAKGGADFSQLAKEYSDDTASVERQGSLGRFARDGMVKPFSDAAFALQVNEVSGVVESPFGFHVIKRNQ